MTTAQKILTILVVVLGTMLTRFLPFFIYPDTKTPPPFITYLGTVLPYAVIGLLIVYCLKDSVGWGRLGIAEAIAILCIIVIHKWKKNTLFSIASGTILYMAFVQTCFV